MNNKITSGTNRRSFLKSTAFGTLGITAISTGLISSCKTKPTDENTFGTVSQAINSGASSVVTRKNIASFAVNDPELQLLKDAVAILRKRSEKWPLDPTGWSENGALHTKFCATTEFTYQVHYSWYVWPWHRTYLWTLEKKLQHAVGEPKLALHYWDWTKHPSIPEQYQGGKENPLYNDTRLVEPNDIIPFDFMNMGPALRAKKFMTFGGYPFPYKGQGPQIDGIAEQSFHNNIHNWIGGEMAGFVAAGYDPIFYGHHGNCDRFWQAWLDADQSHRNPLEASWLEKVFYFTDEKGKPIGIKIKDVLDTKKLGYQFEDLDFNSEDGVYNSLEDKVVPSYDLVKASGIYNTSLEEERKVQSVEKIDLANASHVLLKYERTQLPYMPYCSRVFFLFGDAQPSPENCKYIGTFTILPIVSAEGGKLEKDVYMHVEITRSIRDRIGAGEKIRVFFEPVQVRGRNIPDEPLEVKNITYSFV
ncbi:tyrosinase family protein [Aquimarina mytili]|uniref:Tyrosinase family protein n=1 Tax=Aquimarina mytili TaxID=874423 RepID=A0A937DCB0_9FLAO|nr:tyrosinase family protein [Aquimarina mytili]MBL0684746.1 tyrosinase family protein [Aquimarina mytili]